MKGKGLHRTLFDWTKTYFEAQTGAENSISWAVRGEIVAGECGTETEVTHTALVGSTASVLDGFEQPLQKFFLPQLIQLLLNYLYLHVDLTQM